MTIRVIALIIVLGVLPVSFACDTDGDDPFNPKVPVIESITIARGSDDVTDATVYTGELISITITAESQSVLADCYTPPTENTTYEPDLDTPTELEYSFEIIPPSTTDRTGELIQDTPPGNVAQWRVPMVDDVPGYQTGLSYTIRVTAIDNCVDLIKVGTLGVTVFADKGPPSITSLDVATRPGGDGTYVLEVKDLNDFYEVEPADEVRVQVTAAAISDPSLCTGLGIDPARSLHYTWDANDVDINISGDPDPVENNTVYFDVPDTFNAGNNWTVTLTVLDTCSNAETIREFKFLVVEPPIITTSTVIDDGYEVQFNLYSGFYEVQPGGFDEVIVNAENADPSICSWKGYILTRQYSWTQTLSSTPTPDLVYETLPEENYRSRLTFIVPAAENGTEYNFQLTATDRCNGLSTTSDYPFLVVIAPSLGDSTILEGSSTATYNEITGHYEVNRGSTITATQHASSNCSESFCTGRGVELDESLEYSWSDHLEIFDFVYEPIPDPNSSSTIYYIIPNGSLGQIDTLTVTVTDRCNDVSTSKDFIFEVVG